MTPTPARYWAEVTASARDSGAGFFVTSRLVLTAAHCLAGAAVGDDVTVEVANGRTATGRLVEFHPAKDVALVETEDADLGVELLPADRCAVDDKWLSPYRPTASDPHLAGTVTATDVDHHCEGGDVITALQLATTVELGDYSGYSGGPVEGHGNGAASLIGILLEQYPDRQEPARASNVLIAGSIGQVLLCFERFRIAHLLKVLGGAQPPAGPPDGTGRDAPAAAGERPATELVATAETLLSALEHWGERGLIDPQEVSRLRMRVVTEVVDRSFS